MEGSVREEWKGEGRAGPGKRGGSLHKRASEECAHTH